MRGKGVAKLTGASSQGNKRAISQLGFKKGFTYYLLTYLPACLPAYPLSCLLAYLSSGVFLTWIKSPYHSTNIWLNSRLWLGFPLRHNDVTVIFIRPRTNRYFQTKIKNNFRQRSCSILIFLSRHQSKLITWYVLVRELSIYVEWAYYRRIQSKIFQMNVVC